MLPKKTLASLLLAPLVLGCESPPAPATAANEHACTLVFLKTGPRTDLTKEQSAEVFAGHFANMGRLARERRLLVAGPFGKQRHDTALRGVFVLATADRAAARTLAETDPGVKAGVFVLEYHDLVTEAPLQALLERELAAQERAQKEGKKLAPGEGGRPYVLLTADDGERARAALAGHPAVLLLGRLDRTKAFAVLDAKASAEVPEALGAALPRVGPHALDDWFATGGLARMRELAVGGG